MDAGSYPGLSLHWEKFGSFNATSSCLSSLDTALLLPHSRCCQCTWPLGYLLLGTCSSVDLGISCTFGGQPTSAYAEYFRY